MENKTILETIDPDITERLVSRRQAIAKGAGASSALMTALAFGSVPIALAALSRDALGQGANNQIKDVLDFAFILEQLEAEFYKAVLGNSASTAQNTAFVPVRTAILALPNAASVVNTFELIEQHEIAHVAFLKTQLDAMGGPAATLAADDFDFTGGNGSGMGPFAPATTDVDFLLAATQGFEDTGVRAYKGQAGQLISDDVVLEAALRIHSVEARHASRVRRIRRSRATSSTVIRYSGTIRGGGAEAAGAPGSLDPAVVAAFAKIYGGATPESNTTHAGINAATLPGIQGGVDAATEAFDEPLTAAEVVDIVDSFIIPDVPAEILDGLA
ncbi:MAG: ferritin-like domain-containing protein [Gemmatimonadaceae bacterium]